MEVAAALAFDVYRLSIFHRRSVGQLRRRGPILLFHPTFFRHCSPGQLCALIRRRPPVNTRPCYIEAVQSRDAPCRQDWVVHSALQLGSQTLGPHCQKHRIDAAGAMRELLPVRLGCERYRNHCGAARAEDLDHPVFPRLLRPEEKS